MFNSILPVGPKYFSQKRLRRRAETGDDNLISVWKMDIDECVGLRHTLKFVPPPFPRLPPPKNKAAVYCQKNIHIKKQDHFLFTTMKS